MVGPETGLRERLKMLHNDPNVCERVKSRVFSQAIPNDVPTKISMCDPSLVDGQGKKLKWPQMNEMNRVIFNARREKGVRRNVEKKAIGVRCKRVRV